MAFPGTPEPNIVVVRGSSLPSQRWWKALHLTINTSFQNKDILAFPPSWTRLPTDSKTAATKLAEELGPDGLIAVVLLMDRPIACAGALPHRGDNWIDDVKSADDDGEEVDSKNVEILNGELNHPNGDAASTPLASKSDPSGDWELCCVCVHPMHRRTGLSTKVLRTIMDSIIPFGARRLFSTYVIEETGMYWPHLGFETVPGAGGVLKKGFTHTKGMPGLNADIHFAMGCKQLV